MVDGEEEEGVTGYVLCSMLCLLCDVLGNLKIDVYFFSPNVCARVKSELHDL